MWCVVNVVAMVEYARVQLWKGTEALLCAGSGVRISALLMCGAPNVAIFELSRGAGVAENPLTDARSLVSLDAGLRDQIMVLSMNTVVKIVNASQSLLKMHV